MEIYLIRHTAPLVAKGTCYGQADLDVTHTFLTEAAVIKKYLPFTISEVYSSPLQRCNRLAQHLFPEHSIQLEDDLKEINCGKWELQSWDNIPKAEIDPWTKDLINVRIPGGESYTDVLERVVTWFNKIICPPECNRNIIIVTHGGVIRSLLAHITHTPLHDSFKAFSLNYGCVIKIKSVQGLLLHEVLSNIAREKETHKPSVL